MTMMQTRPLVVLCIAWMAGNACAALLPSSTFWLVWWGLIILTGLGMTMIWLAMRTQRKASFTGTPAIKMRAILLVMAVFILAAAYWHWNDARNISQLPTILHESSADLIGQQIEATGVIAGDIDIDGDRVRFPLEVYRLQPFESVVAEDAMTHSLDHSEASISLPESETIMIQLKLAHEQELQRAYVWQRGDQIAVKGSWKEPGVARNFGTFDYAQYLRKQHIHWMLEASGADSLRAQELSLSLWSKTKGMLLRWNDHVRKQLGRQIAQIFWTVDQGYMKGLLIGDTDDIDPESFAAFSRLGLTHILAISGLHIAIYVGLLLWLLRRIGLTKESACLIVMIVLPFYVLLTGASPSAIRAGLMGMIGLYLASRGLLKDGLHILCLVGWMMLVYEPYYLLDVSFQLSFAVTAGLIIYVPLLSALLVKLPARIRSAIAVTLVAQLISFPLTIYYFNQFSLLSFLANFLLVPVSGLLVLPIGSLALVLSYVWLPAGVWLGSCVSWLNTWCFWLVDLLDSLPGMLTIWASPGLWLMLGYYGLLYVALRWMRDIQQWLEQHKDDPMYASTSKRLRPATFQPLSTTAQITQKQSDQPSILFWKLYARRGLHWRIGWTRHRLVLLPMILMGIVLLLGSWYHSPHYGRDGIVQFLDIGQGDSILITTPAGKHILVDGGGTVNFQQSGQEWRQRKQPYEVGNKLLVPLLKKRGVHELDAVIATHWDQDHVGGLQAVIESIPVRQFLFNGTMPDNHQRDEMIRLLLDKKIPMYAPVAGMSMQPDSATRLDFLAPAASSSQSAAWTSSTAIKKGNGTATMTQQQAMLAAPLPVRENQNLYSLVFMLTLNGRHILFTGDADTTEEQSILNELQLPTLAMPIDVLKVGHHGSKTSTSAEWLAYWQPQLSVISAGVNNRYGHPKQEVLDRLAAVHSTIARTDQQGEIQIRIDASGHMSVRSMLEGKMPAQ